MFGIMYGAESQEPEWNQNSCGSIVKRSRPRTVIGVQVMFLGANSFYIWTFLYKPNDLENLVRFIFLSHPPPSPQS